MEIKIEVFSMLEYFKVTANTALNQFFINNKKSNMDVNKFAEELLNIVVFWDENLVNPNIVHDAESYSIIIEKDLETLKLVGSGSYPKNYSQFKNLLKRALEC